VVLTHRIAKPAFASKQAEKAVSRFTCYSLFCLLACTPPTAPEQPPPTHPQKKAYKKEIF
jgi:hypothetical protein